MIGVAALAPASDLAGLVGDLEAVRGGSVFASYAIQAYADTYPDVTFDTYVLPAARIQLREMASRCLAEPEVFASIVAHMLFDRSIWLTQPTGGAFLSIAASLSRLSASVHIICTGRPFISGEAG